MSNDLIRFDHGYFQHQMLANYTTDLEQQVRRWKRIALILFIAGTAQWVLWWLS